MYKRDFGFDFDAFTPAELFSRIRGTPSQSRCSSTRCNDVATMY